MNRYHRRCCRSPGWSAFMAGTVLPHALDGIDLGPRVLELGPGYGASTRPLAARAFRARCYRIASGGRGQAAAPGRAAPAAPGV